MASPATKQITEPVNRSTADVCGMPGSTSKLALAIPTLCEAANIRTVLDRIRATLDPLGIPYELIVVDDDSRDGTSAIVQKLADADPRVRLLVRNAERGLGGAVLHGWKHTDAEILGVIDADLQHPPELLPQLLKAVEKGSDVALASRYAPQGNLHHWHHPLRHLLSRLAIWLTLPLQRPDIHVADPMSGFFLVRRSCVKDVGLETKGFKILLEVLTRGRVRSVTEVPFAFGPRHAGRSKAGVREGLDYFLLLARLWRHRKHQERTPRAAT